MDLVVTMTEHHIWLVGQMIESASRLDNAQLDAPIAISVEGIDRDPTPRSLLSRLVGQMDMWNQAVVNRRYDLEVERDESIDSMRTRLAGCDPTFLGHVRDACERGGLDDTFVDSTTRVAALLHLRRHDRPRPDLRRVSTDARIGRPPLRRHHRPPLRPAGLGACATRRSDDAVVA
jgi:hypothetical protein